MGYKIYVLYLQLVNFLSVGLKMTKKAILVLQSKDVCRLFERRHGGGKSGVSGWCSISLQHVYLKKSEDQKQQNGCGTSKFPPC